MRPGRLTGIVLWAAALGYMALILWMGSRSDPIPGLDLSGGLDKVAHAAAYGVLALLLAAAFTHSRPARSDAGMVTLAALIATGCGALDELHQSFIASRHGSLGDVVADAFGSFLGAFLFLALHRMVCRKPEEDPGSQADPAGPG